VAFFPCNNPALARVTAGYAGCYQQFIQLLGLPEEFMQLDIIPKKSIGTIAANQHYGIIILGLASEMADEVQHNPPAVPEPWQSLDWLLLLLAPFSWNRS